jgi:hypothetical protein
MHKRGETNNHWQIDKTKKKKKKTIVALSGGNGKAQ